jgi:pimeloyl-ACP methyl ester carboxylesterase
MNRITQRLVILAFVLLTSAGCYSTGSRGAGDGVVLFVPGAGGDGAWYRGINDGLRDAGETRTIRTFAWGMPGALFVMNFNDKGVHARAEQKLADVIAKQPTGPIDIVAHSAGCGVTLGALKQLPEGVRVRRVVLMSPSVSPGYDLAPSLARAEKIDVCRSERDTLFLSWRVSHFGTYDGVKTRAAGNVGFATSDPRVTQHAWTEADTRLGHDGGHFGATSRAYVASVFSLPPPLAGEGWGGGSSNTHAARLVKAPLPNPPPQAGEGTKPSSPMRSTAANAE